MSKKQHTREAEVDSKGTAQVDAAHKKGFSCTDEDSHESGSSNVKKEQGVLETCKKERDQWKDQFLRVTADFENFKRRMEKEQSVWYQTAQAQLLLDLLNVVDDFDRAVEEKQKEERSKQLEVWLSGFELIHKSLHALLKKYEIEELADMKEFDPRYHEALAHIESPKYKSGHIVDVLQKGYTFKGELLRPAKVTVAK